VNHVAGISLFRIENPLTGNWLLNLLNKLGDEDREQLAQSFDRFLTDATPAVAEGAYKRWFKKYWETRLLGIPKPLVAKEANEMVFWPLGLGKYFPDAVNLVLGLKDLVAFEYSDLLYRLHGKGLAKAFPEATAALVLFFLHTKPKFFHLSEETKAVWKDLKLGGGVSPETLKAIREAMLQLGADPEEE
jgi:hypothetical protein